MAESAVSPVTFGVKVTRETPGHVSFNLFAGRGTRGCAGGLTLRHDEFEAFTRQLQVTDIDDPARQECCNQPNYVWEHSRGPSDYFRCHSCRGVMTKPRRQDRVSGGENTDG